ncbi:diacylglycerol/lipid kinase family protein [Salipaludibacillus daqingensis]|uniref:diacylglycerol/lipid kinase family protein n=1 Tax=Salipaludibacillus daqingensis TaxID=3041001 RepID=UPI0024747D5E|nr:diacylglycerol kinase family lipid kinase [Salipaludibacillus daqingensis]
MYIIIVNSHSGRLTFREVSKQLSMNSDISFVPYFTGDYQEEELWTHAIRFIKENIPTIQGIIIVGGDGTFHQAINHLHNFEIPLGLIPTGSANDFAKALKIPSNEKKALSRIRAGNPKTYDLFKVNDEWVHSLAGMGVDAETAIKSISSPLKKWLNRAFLGRLTYLLTFFTVIKDYKPFQMKLTFQDGESLTYERVWLLAIGNTAYYGGGIPICPKADPQDGKLEITIVHSLSLITLLFVLPTVFFRLHTMLPYVETMQAKALSVKTSQPVLVQADGEKAGYTPQTITIKPKSIKIF